MKFAQLNKSSQRVYDIDLFDKGLNLAELPENIDDRQLSSCINMIFDGKSLKTRKGFSANQSDIIFNNNSNEYDFTNFKVRNQLYINGENRTVMTADVTDDETSFITRVFFVGNDKTVINGGMLSFNRVSEDEFYKPINYLFFKGKPISGAGIFLFVTLQNENLQKYYNIFEIDENLNLWIENHNYYIPTIYINGRGDKFDLLKSTNQVYEEKPKEPESLNLLCGNFYAYFTSDGYSSIFKLPLNNLSNSSIKIKIHKNLNEFTEWVLINEQNKCTMTFCNANVTLNVDRSKGLIYFTDYQGAYPIPLMNDYPANNICVLAEKETKNEFENIVSSDNHTVINNYNLFTSGLTKNKIFCSDYNNPLYFPLKSSLSIGDADDKINAICSQKNKAIIFKQNEIYTASITQVNKSSQNVLLSFGNEFNELVSLKASLVSKNIGCIFKNTICSMDKFLIWLSNDKKIRCASIQSSGEIYDLSWKIDKLISSFNDLQLENSFAVCENNKYMLMIGTKAVIMEINEKSFGNFKNLDGICFYEYDFPCDILLLGAFNNNGKTVFINSSSDGKICYASKLNENKDCSLIAENDLIKTETFDIKSSVNTKKLCLSKKNSKVKLDKIDFSLASTGTVNISVNGIKKESVKSRSLKSGIYNDNLCNVSIKTVSINENLILISFSSSCEFSLGSLTVFYHITE